MKLVVDLIPLLEVLLGSSEGKQIAAYLDRLKSTAALTGHVELLIPEAVAWETLKAISVLNRQRSQPPGANLESDLSPLSSLSPIIRSVPMTAANLRLAARILGRPGAIATDAAVVILANVENACVITNGSKRAGYEGWEERQLTANTSIFKKDRI